MHISYLSMRINQSNQISKTVLIYIFYKWVKSILKQSSALYHRYPLIFSMVTTPSQSELSLKSGAPLPSPVLRLNEHLTKWFETRVSFAWSVITHYRSDDEFLVINQFHIIDHVIKTQIIETIFFIWYHERQIKNIVSFICVSITWSIIRNW